MQQDLYHTCVHLGNGLDEQVSVLQSLQLTFKLQRITNTVASIGRSEIQQGTGMSFKF